MKKIKLILLTLLAPLLSYSQEISGDWHGLLKVQGMEMRLIFHITASDSGLLATFDSPDQKAFGIPVSSVNFNEGLLDIQMANIGAQYKGKLIDHKIEGEFYQASHAFPLILTPEPVVVKKQLRPQEPKPPYPYHAEEVTFTNEEAGVTLAGTLTLPSNTKHFPTAILISGSGPQNRDEEFMTHKPFLVLADHLTRNGIAVLRYDDRGFGASSGKHALATSADFAEDVKAAIHYLKSRKDIDRTKIGLIGHSEGGLIAPMVAAESPLGFMVLLAGPGYTGAEISLQQIALMGKLQNADDQVINNEIAVSKGIFELIKKYEIDLPILKKELEAYIINQLETNKVVLEGMTHEEYAKKQAMELSRPWMRYFVSYNPKPTLSKVKCPVLALNGEKDVQVGPKNLEIIEKALIEGGNTQVTIKEFEDMNHLFQLCETGSLAEYAQIETTMEPIVLETIAGWIKKQN